MRKIKHGKMSGGCSDSCCLKLEGVSVHIQGEDILEDVSFHLHCGEITALIGPNGAGKSTLFRSVLGQLSYQGNITFSPAGGPAIRLADGTVMGGTRPLIGYVPQSPSFDRGDPISVLDFFTAALVLGYGLFFASRGTVLAVGVLMVLLAAIQALYQPSVQASIPALASEEHLPAANGVVAQVQALANLLGPILGGMLYGWVGLLPMVAVGGACFFCSAVMELFLRIPFQRRTLAGPPLAALWRDLRDAGRFLTREQPGLLRVLALVALLNLFLSALLVVGLPYLVKISLGLSSLHYSFAEAALSLGSIVGGLLSGLVLRGADIRRAWRFLLGTSLLLLPMALALALGIPSLAAYGVILVSVLLGMACAMLFTVSAQTYLQRATPPHLLGKVASFVAAISTCAMPLGQALYGLLFDALQAHVWVVVALGMGASLLVTFSSVRALGRLPALDEAPSGGYTEQSLDS